ncbi:MAG TPA: F0F1 ATP synthase subunit B [Candidatus Nanopelagicales bacterium]
MHTAFIVAAEEPNPLVPAPYDIIWGSISFFILLGLFWKFVLPSFNRMVDERAEKIEGGIEQAKVMQAEAARTRDAYTAQLEAANKEAASIRTGAQSEGEQIIAAARAEAAVQAAAVTARADAQIQAERDAAVGSLQRDVGALALELASRIVGESLTDDQRARATVDRFIAELEATPAPGAATP